MLTRFIGVIFCNIYKWLCIYYHVIQIIVQIYKSLCCTLVTNMMLYVTYFGVKKQAGETGGLRECSAWRGRGDWYRESLENDHRGKCRWGRGDYMRGSRFWKAWVRTCPSVCMLKITENQDKNELEETDSELGAPITKPIDNTMWG